MVRLFGRKKKTAAPLGRLARIRRRILRSLGFVLRTLLLLVSLLFLSLLIGPTRGLMLTAGLHVAGTFLPGDLAVGKAAWPRPGHLVFRDLVWTGEEGVAAPDTLVDLALLDLNFDFDALRSREVQVDSLTLRVRSLDLPVLLATVAPGEEALPDSTEVREEPVEPPQAEGALSGIPSVAVDRFDLEVERARVAPDLRISDVAVKARLEAGRSQGPLVKVSEASGRLRGTIPDSSGGVVLEADLIQLGLGASVDTTSIRGGDLMTASAALDSVHLILENVRVGTIVTCDELELEANGSLSEGRWADLVLTLGTGEVRGGGPTPEESWSVDPLRLELGVGADVPSLVEGKLSGMEARIDSLTLETRRVGLGPQLEIHDLSLGSTAELSPSQPARLTVQELAAVVRGTVVDSTSVRSWALELDHLGLGAQVLADTNAAGNLRLVSARLDSLFLDLAPVGPMAESGGWMPKDALSLDVTAGVTREETAYDAELSVDFALPGTAHFPDLLPEDFPHEAFGALAGTIDLAGRYDDPQVAGDLHIDIEETTWVEAGRLEVHIDADREALAAGDLSDVVAVADSFALGVTGLGLFLDGGVDQGDLDLHLVLGIDDLGLAQLFVPEISEDDSLVVGADLLLEGTLDQPRVTGFVEGGARVLDYSVPSLRLDLGGDASHVTVDLAAGGGLELAGTSLDSVTAFLHGLRDTSGAMEADFALGVWGREFSTSLGGYATWDSVRTLRIDSLAVRTPEGALDLEDPVTLTIGPGDQDIALSSLLITGDPGNLELEGYRTAEELTSRVLADLLLTEAMLQFVAPSPLWSLEGGQDLSVEADIDLGGTSDNPEFTGNSRVRLIPHRDKPPLGVNLDLSLAGGDDGGLTAVMGFTSADTVMLEGTTTWPGRVDLVAGTWKPDRDRDMTLEIPRQRMDLARFNRLLPDDVEMKGSCELSANVALPRLGSDEGADPLENGRLDFRFETQKLRVDLPNRSRIDFTMNIEASGNLKDPLVKGRVEVGSAFFRIPEIPRNLHPMEAPSMLWALRDSVAARLDSTMALADSFDVFAIPEAEGPILGPKGPGYLPELDLQILIPRNVRITGYGMDLEIEGDIKVARGFDEDGRPGSALTGFVRIRQGTLQFMNRVFKPERGQVDFTGTVPPDPRLDLMLEANVSGTIVRILVSGSASDPVIDLTSEPEMPQEDVVSVLLFGRPLNDLDTDQRNNMDDGGDPAKELRENLAGLAMVFGTAGLQNQMSNTLGVDMVQLGSDSSGGSTLMVGKFISPNLMVKYHASLEKSGTYFMTLEYTLSRFFKLVTTYGQGDEASGAELQWSKRY